MPRRLLGHLSQVFDVASLTILRNSQQKNIPAVLAVTAPYLPGGCTSADPDLCSFSGLGAGGGIGLLESVLTAMDPAVKVKLAALLMVCNNSPRDNEAIVTAASQLEGVAGGVSPPACGRPGRPDASRVAGGTRE